MTRSVSLRWQLVRRLVLAQAILLVTIVALVMGSLWMAGLLRDKSAYFAAEAIAESLHRDAAGRLRLVPGDRLRELRRRQPDLAALIRDARGQEIAIGAFAPEMMGARRLLIDFPAVERADFWLDAGSDDPQFHLDTIDTPAGPVRLIVDVRRPLSFPEFAWTIGMVGVFFILPLIVAMSLIALGATLVVVRRSFRRLDEIVIAAEAIDPLDRRIRLPETHAPQEIAPLIAAINEALDRLDQGYGRQARFLADAAHELRTPIAIVQARIDGMADGPAADRLRRDVARLGTLAEQLLDLQRLTLGPSTFANIELAPIARRVAADLAPIVIANHCEVSVEDHGSVPVEGDEASVERVLTNLVQNAIEHGGRQVVIRIQGATIEVEDDGPGVPPSERERIFEPFHRLRARVTGAGLGLNLVRQVMDRHKGRIEVGDAPDGGTIMKLEFVRGR